MGYRLVFLPKPPRARTPEQVRLRSRWVLALLVTIWCALAFSASTSSAADDDRRLTLARDALHRAQESLQSTQAERDALSKKAADLEAQKAVTDKALAQASAQQRGDAARLGGQVAALQAERDQLKADLARQHEEAAAQQERLGTAQAKEVDTETRLAEQRRLVVSMRTLLQRSVQAVSEGEKQNHALYDVGQHAIDDFRQCQVHGSGYSETNAPGLPDVRATDVAEKLRKEMDALASPATAAAAAAPAAVGRP